ncbi:hypothetical protein IC006_0126 [Sulfuracidifex tepidarius]|uniref:Uncharacterized protein n=1 Tax=Sulfuracidifex tepidarius TaxID=1294262 RepID=A0A510DZD4_9CREN|nr:hypothetical protein [Sulfuracidifex tepidarius]BBG22842.1 hypothetical protein IC006_0126 [Sulfuracidifex tepidarius]BBG25603.1 hypothetical protein IC007_0108 [Sulfuracidifex tepidarius]
MNVDSVSMNGKMETLSLEIQVENNLNVCLLLVSFLNKGNTIT